MGELYATACAIGGVSYLLLNKYLLAKDLNLFLCVVIVVALRIYSKRKRLMLPEI